MAEMADALNEKALAGEARAAAETTRAAVEKTYWLGERGFYGFATTVAPEKPPQAEPGPSRERRQTRLDELALVRFVDEDTVLPAVPLWWGQLEDARAQAQLDHIGAGAIATDWGARILADTSRLYDPLSYHYGSVWPLFTGWASMGAYRYGRPQVGYQALMANALLRSRSAIGYVTELLSGDFNTPFGRSSDHQVWSEAMVVSPCCGACSASRPRRAAGACASRPRCPRIGTAWPSGTSPWAPGRCDLSLSRAAGRMTIDLVRRGEAAPLELVAAPAFPLDARVRSVRVDGGEARFQARRTGDLQRAEVACPGPRPAHRSSSRTTRAPTSTHRPKFRSREREAAGCASCDPARRDRSCGWCSRVEAAAPTRCAHARRGC